MISLGDIFHWTNCTDEIKLDELSNARHSSSKSLLLTCIRSHKRIQTLAEGEDDKSSVLASAQSRSHLSLGEADSQLVLLLYYD